MSGIFNFVTIVLLIVSSVGFDFFEQYKKRLFPVQRSSSFVYYSINPAPYRDGQPCRPDAHYNPIHTAETRARECWASDRIVTTPTRAKNKDESEKAR